ncbi:DUF6716 putative glycosyltransferase [Pseudoruegeria sp. HB172150]|uniref:DUF6716 putative glycosyltransferase n=1 Tax=Pseudoruegeria sp. HB172150 TaxID=2721164 RepID=UPI001552DF5E|nr:DUF6716 putative glycosyltransferase [Pseudoruegeria sp. HB172150]
MSAAPIRILLPFSDDSTLFFVQRMRAVLEGHGCELCTAWLTSGSPLSYRQLTAVLPEGPDILLLAEAFRQVTPLQEFDAIVTSRVFAPLRDMLKKAHLRHMAGRPCVIAFQGGLDFDPERGFANRSRTDSLFIVPKGDIARYRAVAERLDAGAQYLGFGHPTFLGPPPVPEDLAARRDVVFFAQALSPATRAGRLFVLRMLAAVARAHPERTVWIKLRHLPHENRDHLHREELPYPELIAALPGPCPANLRLTAEPMDDVLARAGIGITCTSTAAVDLVRAGVPALVFLDYAENYLDPLVPPMRRLFAESGLIAGVEEVLQLCPKTPETPWLETFFICPEALAAQVLEAVAAFRQRPVAVRRVLPPLV